MAPREYENGDVILQQNDIPMMSPMAGVVMEPIDGMFLVIEGAAQAVKSFWFDKVGVVVYDYRVGKDRLGDYFGEGTFLGAEVSHLLIYQSPACFTDPLIVIDMLLRAALRLSRPSATRA